MKKLTAEITEYIKGENVGVLAIQMLDDSPHASAVHFAYDEQSQMFLFETYQLYRKCEALFGRETSKASFVIGSTETNMKTLQLDGEARLLKEAERALYDEVYFGKFPKKKEKATDSKFVFFVFVPTWWRFTDWTRKEGKVIISSEDK